MAIIRKPIKPLWAATTDAPVNLTTHEGARADVIGTGARVSSPDHLPRDMADIARASYAAAQSVIHAAPKRQAAGRTISAGLIDIMVSDASDVARAIAPRPSDALAADVWGGVIEALAELDLSPVRYCTRTGRNLGVISPDTWTDYLCAIAQLGDTRAGDAARQRLLDAIIVDKAHVIAPPVLTSSAGNLAVIRATSPADYLAICCARLWPLDRRAQSLARAQWAEQLGQTRAAIAQLPIASQQYACEITTLFLSNIDPARLEQADNLLTYYKGDFSRPWQSVASLGQFCGRLVQMLAQLIMRHRIRPLDQISRADMRALRIHWRGVPEFQAAKAERAAHRAAIAAGGASALAALDRTGQTSLRTVQALQAAGALRGSLVDDFAQSFLDALDMQAALASTGRKVSLVADNDAEAARARTVLRQYRANSSSSMSSAPQHELDPFADNLLDLSDLLSSGVIPDDLLPVIDSEEDLISAGLLSVSDLLSDDFDMLGGDDDDDEAEDAEDAESDLSDFGDSPDMADLIAEAMGQARAPRLARRPAPSTQKPARRPSAIDDLTAQALELALSVAPELAAPSKAAGTASPASGGARIGGLRRIPKA